MPVQELTSKKLPIQNVVLTQEQQTVTERILPLISKPRYAPMLLHGVTGSGKTEVYKKIIQKAVYTNKSVLLLLPEVTLALQFERLLKKNITA